MPKIITITKEQYIQVEALSAYLTQEQIADYLGIARSTFNKKLDEDESLYGHYKKGKAKAIGKAASKLLEAIDKGNMTAIIFFLKTQAGWKETTDEEQKQPTSINITFTEATKPE
jgi:hypothetical protein